MKNERNEETTRKKKRGKEVSANWIPSSVGQSYQLIYHNIFFTSADWNKVKEPKGTRRRILKQSYPTTVLLTLHTTGYLLSQWAHATRVHLKALWSDRQTQTHYSHRPWASFMNHIFSSAVNLCSELKMNSIYSLLISRKDGETWTLTSSASKDICLYRMIFSSNL